ncbi:MAG: terminase [Steroidobacteraceae bacterium]
MNKRTQKSSAATKRPRRKRPRKESALWKPAFIESMAKTCNVTLASQAAGISRTYAYQARDADPQFAAAWDEAEQSAVDVLEAEARRRAAVGVSEPVFHKGVQIASVRKYSDVLLIFLLKAHRPEKYRERIQHEVTPGDGATFTLKIKKPRKAAL